MKKVIYACFLLVASMSIVSCEKDDPKGKKDKEEQKEEQPVEKTKYVLLDFVKESINDNRNKGAFDTIYVYKEDLSLDYKKVENSEEVEKYYYNEYNDVVKRSIYHKQKDMESAFIYTYKYENGRKVSSQAFFDNQKVEDRTYTYNEEGYIIKEEASNVIEFKYNGTRGFIKYDYVRNNFREDEYGNYVCDRSDIYESDIYEDETINYIELLIPNAQNEYNEDGLLISKSYIDCYGENYKLEYIYKEYYK
jgi:hypothetical protein